MKEKRVYMYVATGGFWGEDHMQDGDTNGACPHCGKSHVCTRHMLWQRPIINQNRSFNDLCEFQDGCLPDAVANGLPLAMAASNKQAYWGTSDHEGIDDASMGLIGIPLKDTKREMLTIWIVSLTCSSRM